MNMFPITVNLPDPGADNKQEIVFTAPTDALGGGVRILSGRATTMTTLSGAGTTFTLALHKYSNAGTPAVNGTIAAAIGASGWAAGVPQAFTIDSDYSFLDAGESLVIDYQELATVAPGLTNITIWAQVGK